MADKQAPADANVGWQELKTSKGVNYQIKGQDYDIAGKPAPTGDEVAAHGPDFSNVQLNWATNTSGDTSADIQEQTAITWYNLEKAPWYSIFKWRLTINVKDTYDYVFTDATGDTYSLSTWQLGTHTVDYNSSSPTIVSVSGS